MGHLLRLKEEYRELARRLGTGIGYAFVEPEDPGAWKAWQEILEILYTPDEAALAARMPLLPEPLDRLARRFELPENELLRRLESMCDKGIVMDLVDPKDQTTTYLLSPPIAGFFEFSLMRARDSIPKKRIAEAFEVYMEGDPALARELLDGDPVLGRTLVHESAIPEDTPEVLDWERATHVVESARTVAVSLCSCRHKAQHVGTVCDAPLDNCLSLGAGAEFVIRRGFGRKIDRAQALETLAEARRFGLVHIADNVQGHPLFVCNCCKCCCEQIRPMNHYDIQGVNPSGFLATCHSHECAGCSRCARACPVGAVGIAVQRGSDGKSGPHRRNRLQAVVDAERCIGCGVCVSACRKGAMAMERRKKLPHVPVNAVEKAVRIALEQNRLADLVFDQGKGAGTRFLNRALKAILGLPPAKRLLATEQLKSRFVRVAVAKIKDPSGSDSEQPGPTRTDQRSLSSSLP